MLHILIMIYYNVYIKMLTNYNYHINYIECSLPDKGYIINDCITTFVY